MLFRSQSPNTNLLDHEIIVLEAQIEKCDKTISKLILLLTETDDSNLMYSYKLEIKNQTAQKQTYQERLNELQLTLQSTQNSITNVQYVLASLEYFLKYFDQMSIAECQTLLKTIIHHIEWTGTGIKVYLFQNEKEQEIQKKRNSQKGGKITYAKW